MRNFRWICKIIIILLIIFSGFAQAYERLPGDPRWQEKEAHFYVGFSPQRAGRLEFEEAFIDAIGHWQGLADFNFQYTREYISPSLGDFEDEKNSVGIRDRSF